jgi:hypothetical protein
MGALLPVLLLAACAASASAAPAGDAAIRLNYTLHCMGCHKADGSGQGNFVPPMRGYLGRFLLVSGGREYLVQVPGTAQSLLGSRETAEMLNWALREFDPQHVPADFVPYTEDEVARLRQRPLSAPSAERKRLLESIRAASAPAAH